MPAMSKFDWSINLDVYRFKFSNGMRSLPSSSSFIKVLFAGYNFPNPIDYFDQNCEYFVRTDPGIIESLKNLQPTKCNGQREDQCQFNAVKLTRLSIQRCMGGLVPVF